MRILIVLVFFFASACTLDRSAIGGDSSARIDAGPQQLDGGREDAGPRDAGPRDGGVDAFVPEDAGHSTTIVDIAAGIDFTCALRSDGVVRCWGLDTDGQLGNGTTTSTASAVTVALPAPAVSIAAGSAHACAIVNTNELYCWGANDAGQVGAGGAIVARPARVTDRVRAVALGGAHSCLIDMDDQVMCWGANASGQLGTVVDMASGHSTPEALDVGLSAESLALGSAHSCAISGGQAQCWGLNHDGQLGTANTTDVAAPFPVFGLTSDVTVIGAGASHTCAVHGGMVSCWGKGTNGRLGDGSNSGSNSPASVDLDGATWIDGGGEHTCALRAGGLVSCWGRNNAKQLGPMASVDSNQPIDVPMPDGLPAEVLALGGNHTCALVDGAVYCWGGDSNNQLGAGASGTAARPDPTFVPDI